MLDRADFYVEVSYGYTNRTSHMKFTREGAEWVKKQIDSMRRHTHKQYLTNFLTDLASVKLTNEELNFLRLECPFLTKEFFTYIQTFTFRPSEQIEFEFQAESGTSSPTKQDLGSIILLVKGLWLETILYEIPLLALISEAYFKFCDTNWSHDGQLENARVKGLKLIKSGCVFSEFGSRRRRDYHTQDLVNQGLVEAAKQMKDGPGKLSGTSNVHFAMKYGIPPIGTVAHEWFMGVAAITDDYENANELALKYWVGTFGPGVSSCVCPLTFTAHIKHRYLVLH
jgi:nicotinate phosphoribosyltransferase